MNLFLLMPIEFSFCFRKISTHNHTFDWVYLCFFVFLWCCLGLDRYLYSVSYFIFEYPITNKCQHISWLGKAGTTHAASAE